MSISNLNFGIKKIIEALDVDLSAIGNGKIISYNTSTEKFEFVDGPAFLGSGSKLIYVDKTGNDTTGSGTIINPFLTIGKAITEAKTKTPSYTNPVVIIVGPGEYSEQVILDYHGIHLISFGQYVTRLKRAGNCLTIADNGTDPEPHDLKIIGFSIESTNAEYSVIIQGIAGTSLAGNELMMKDCAVLGANSIHANIANYLDYQNCYVTGAELYEQIAGVWFEHSQRSGQITNDYNNAGIKPSDTGHYGLNFVGSYVPTDPILLNSGIIGAEDMRLNKLGSGSAYVFIFEPNIAASLDNRYKTWPELMTAISGIHGPKIIELDNAGGTLTNPFIVPAGAYDLEGVEFRTAPGSTGYLRISSGVTFTNCFSKLNNCVVDFRNNAVVKNLAADEACVIHITNTGGIITTNAASKIFGATGSGITFQIIMDNSSFLDVQNAANWLMDADVNIATLQIKASGSCDCVNDGVFRSTNASSYITIIYENSCNINTALSGVTAGFITVTIKGGHIISNAGTPFATQRKEIDFVGAGVTVTDDSVNDKYLVTIPGGGGGGLSNMFLVNHSNSPVISIPTGGAPFQLIFDAEITDTGSNYDLLLGKYTVPATGYYEFSAQIQGVIDSLDTGGELALIIAYGATVISWSNRFWSSNQIAHLQTYSGPVQITAASEVTLLASWNGSVALPLQTTQQRNYFTGRKLG